MSRVVRSEFLIVFIVIVCLFTGCFVPAAQPEIDPAVFSTSNTRDACLFGSWLITGQDFADHMAKAMQDGAVWTGTGEIIVSFDQAGMSTGRIQGFSWQTYDPDGDSTTGQALTEVFTVDDYYSESKWGNVNEKEIGLELVSTSGEMNITVESSSQVSQLMYDLLFGAFKGSLNGMSMGNSGIVSYQCTADKLSTSPETASDAVFYTRVR